jgi:Uma2 family endonuclease
MSLAWKEGGLPGETATLALDPRVSRRPITVAEFLRMGEVGILNPRDRVELIEGELIAMAPIGTDHAGTVIALFEVLADATRGRALVSPQNPVQLSNRSLPQPDYAVLVPRPDRYRTSHPRPHEVLLLIEVANSSLDYDRGVKRALYARHGISEFWIINLVDGDVEVCRSPGRDGYASVTTFGRDAVLEPELLPGARIRVADILG